MLLFSRDPCVYSSTLLPMSSLAFCQSDAVSMYWTTSCSVSLWANRVDPLWAYEFMSVSFVFTRGENLTIVTENSPPLVITNDKSLSKHIWYFSQTECLLVTSLSASLLFWCHAGMIPWIKNMFNGTYQTYEAAVEHMISISWSTIIMWSHPTTFQPATYHPHIHLWNNTCQTADLQSPCDPSTPMCHYPVALYLSSWPPAKGRQISSLVRSHHLVARVLSAGVVVAAGLGVMMGGV